ncbi:hypothetical protein R3P38DRAFT_2778292 [Favolaschia claudopus]|uniref:Uncharacterized protein n=1 Tax=Favolaschia claudopus TaxID=2862362 RepID=A0AAW0BJ79_9AGAR
MNLVQWRPSYKLFANCSTNSGHFHFNSKPQSITAKVPPRSTQMKASPGDSCVVIRYQLASTSLTVAFSTGTTSCQLSKQAAPQLKLHQSPSSKISLNQKATRDSAQGAFSHRRSTQIAKSRLGACGKMKPLLKPISAPLQMLPYPLPLWNQVPRAASISLLAAIDDKCSLEEAATLALYQVITRTFAQILEPPSMRRQRASPPELFQPQAFERLLRKVLQAMIQGQHSSHELLQDLYQDLCFNTTNILSSLGVAVGCEGGWLKMRRSFDVRFSPVVKVSKSSILRLQTCSRLFLNNHATSIVWGGKVGALHHAARDRLQRFTKQWTPGESSAGGQLRSGCTMQPLAIKPGCQLFASWPPFEVYMWYRGRRHMAAMCPPTGGVGFVRRQSPR